MMCKYMYIVSGIGGTTLWCTQIIIILHESTCFYAGFISFYAFYHAFSNTYIFDSAIDKSIL